jgi:hypothetical protein
MRSARRRAGRQATEARQVEAVVAAARRIAVGRAAGPRASLADLLDVFLLGHEPLFDEPIEGARFEARISRLPANETSTVTD